MPTPSTTPHAEPPTPQASTQVPLQGYLPPLPGQTLDALRHDQQEAAWNRLIGRGFLTVLFVGLLGSTLRQIVFPASTTFAVAPSGWGPFALLPLVALLWLPWQRMGRPTPQHNWALVLGLMASMAVVLSFAYMGGIRPWWQLPLVSAAVVFIIARMGRHGYPSQSWCARSKQHLWRVPLNNAQAMVWWLAVAFAVALTWLTVRSRAGGALEAHLMARGLLVYIGLIVLWVSQWAWATQGRPRDAIHEDLALVFLWMGTVWLALHNLSMSWLSDHSTTEVVSGVSMTLATVGVVAVAAVHVLGAKRWTPRFILWVFPSFIAVAMSLGRVPILAFLPLSAWVLGTFVPVRRMPWAGLAWLVTLGVVFHVHGWVSHVATHALMGTVVLLACLFMAHHPHGLMHLARADNLDPTADGNPASATAPQPAPSPRQETQLDPADVAIIQRRINHIGAVVALLVLSITLTGWWVWRQSSRTADALAQTDRMARVAESVQQMFWKVEQSTLKLGLLANHKPIDEDRFWVWSENELKQLPPGTDLQWAPDGVLTFSQPNPMPPALFGMDVRDQRNHQIGAQVRQALALGNAMWTDPFELAEGGTGMARYAPVYNHAHHDANGMPALVGFSLGLLRFPQAFDNNAEVEGNLQRPLEIWGRSQLGTDMLLHRSGPVMPDDAPWQTLSVSPQRWDQARFADTDLINPSPRGSQLSLTVRVGPAPLGIWGDSSFAWQSCSLLAILLGWLARQVAGTRLTLTQTQQLNQRIQSAQSLLNESIVGMALFDAEGRHVASNQTIYALSGAPEHAFVKRNLRELPPVIASGQVAFETLRDGVDRDNLYEGISLWGTQVCVTVHYKRLMWDNHPYLLMQVVDQRSNMDAQRKLESALRRLSIAASFGGTLFWNYSFAQQQLAPIDGFEPFMGTPMGERAFEQYFERIHPEDAPGLRALYITALKTGEVQRAMVRYRHPEGSLRYHKSSMQALLNPRTGRADEIFGITADITAVVQENEARQRANAQMAQILNALPLMVVVRRMDAPDDAPSEFANRAYRDKLDLGAEDVVNAPMLQRLVGPAATQAHRQRKAAHFRISDATFQDTMEGHNAQGEFISLAVTSAVFTGLDGAPRIINSLMDITPLTLAVHQARQADEAKTQFLATMSHEMRTPLGAALGYAQLLQATSLSDSQARLLHKLSVSGSMLMEIINNILDLSRIEAQELVLSHAPFALADVRRAIEDMFGALAQQRGLSLGVAPLPPELAPQHMGDELRVRQILTNLVGNALKFTPQGSVQVRFAAVPGPDDAHQGLRIEVQDTGIGIAADQQSKLFQRFTQVDGTQTRGFGGTGLGLAIVKELAQHMGGDVHVRSQEGQGSTFVVDLVLAVATAEALVSSHSKDDPLQAATLSGQSLAGLRILVVDDNPMNLEVTEAMLSQHGATVHLALNGLEAVEWVRANPGAAQLVLMDVHMPIMDGLTATQRIRALPDSEHLPILAVSAGALNSEINTALQTGMNGYLMKPFEEAQLVRTVLQHCTPVDAPLGGSPEASVGASVEASPDVAEQMTVEPATSATHAATNAATDAPTDWPAMPGIDLDAVQAPLNKDRTLHARQLRHLLRSAQSRPLAVADEEDAKTLAGHIHKLTGMASILGATELAAHARAAEQALKLQQPADDALLTLRDTLARLQGDSEPALAHLVVVTKAERQAARAEPPALDAASLQALLTDLNKRRFSAVRRYQQLRLAIHARLGDGDADALDEAMDTPNFPMAEGLLVPLLRFL